MNPKKLIRPAVFAGIFLGLWGLAVLVARPSAEDPLAHPYVGVRGASREKASGLMVLVGEGGLARALRPDEAVKPGEMLHFVARVERVRYFALAYRDGNGQVTRAFPDGAEAERIEPGRPLPIAFPVDADPRPAVVTAYWSDRPFALAPFLAPVLAAPGATGADHPDADSPVLDPTVEPVVIRIAKAR
jgi:hypothetical protein